MLAALSRACRRSDEIVGAALKNEGIALRSLNLLDVEE
jgi:hypothetical protein